MPYPGSGVSSFEANPLFSSFSHQGINLGNPMLNMMMMMLVGQNYMPSSVNGQSIHESLIQRERSRQFMNLQRESFSNSMLFEKMGIGGSSALGVAGMFASSPDSLLARGLSPLIGGNPMAASMQVYAGLSGANTMGAFGRLGGVDARETMDITRSLADKFYTHQSYEGDRESEKRQELERSVRKNLIQQMDQGAVGADYLKDVGLVNQEDIQDGELTPRAREKVINRLKYTEGKITPGENQGELGKRIEQTALKRKNAAENAERAIEHLESSRKDGEDGETSDNLIEADNRLRNVLESEYKMSKEDIDKLNKPDTKDLDVSKVREIIKKNRVVESPIERDMAADQKDRKYEGTAGHRQEIEDRIRKNLLDRLDQGKAGANYLKDLGLVSSQDIVDGQLTPEAKSKVSEKIKDTSTKITPGEGQGELGRKIEQAMLEKQFAAAEIEKSLGEVEKYREDRSKVERVKVPSLLEDTSETAEANKKRREDKAKALNKTNEDLLKADEKLKKQLADDYGMSKEDISKLNKSGTSELDAAKVREAVEKNRAMNTPIEREMLEAQRSRRADGRYTGFNFNNSRGFLLEDFTSGFVKAAEYRMLGTGRKSASAAMGDFAENSGRALDAARSVFGDRSGGELMEKINEFMGTAKADLSTKTGASDVENLLRNVTATARVAGLSIKTMLGIIDSAKQLAAQSPQLQRANSAGLATMSTSIVRSAAGMGAMMSAEDYRQAGGSQGLAAEEMQSRMGYAGSEIGGFTAALMMAGGEKVRNYFKERGAMTAKDFNNGGIKEIAKIMGKSEQDVMRIGYNEHFQQMAMKNKDVLETITGQFGEETITQSFYDLAHNVGIKEDEVRQKYKKHIEAGGTWDEFEATTFADLPPQGQAMLTAHRATLRKQLLRSTMPVDQVKQLDKLSEDSQKIDKELSEKYSAFSAKPITQVVNALMQSKTVNQASEAIASIFSTKGDSEEMKAAREQARTATEELHKELTGPNSNKESLIRQNKLAPQLNKLMELRNKEEGRTGEKAYGLDKDTSTADLQEMVETIKTVGLQDPLQATKQLKDLEELEKQGKKLSPRELQLKKALTNAKKLSFLDSDKAFEQIKGARAGEELQAVGAAGITAYTEFKTKQQYNELEKASFESSAKALDIAAKGTDTTAKEAQLIQEKYGTGQEGFKKAAEAFRKAQDGTEENIFTTKGTKERNKDFGYFGQLVETNKSQIEQIEARRKGLDDTTSMDPMKQMTSTIDDLKKMIQDGGGIKSAINALVTEIAKMNN